MIKSSRVWVLGLCLLSPLSASAATYSVTNAGDSGAGTLRQAILDANSNAGSDTITFAISPFGPISPVSALPAITETVIIDGTTQSGFVGNPIVVLDGSGAGAGVTGLVVQAAAANSVIAGLVVNNFTQDGIDVYGPGSTVRGCWVGLDGTGTAAAPNGSWGIYVGGDSVTIGGSTAADRNVLSGNSTLGTAGVSIGAGTGSTIKGNYVGLDYTGTAAVANNTGIVVGGSSAGVVVGGTAAGERNVVSGNTLLGMDVNTPATIQGNFIGTNATGTAAVPNHSGGILIRNTAPGSTVGGTAPGAGNLVSGNTSWGIGVDGSNSVVQGNIVGMDVTATSFIFNGGSTVFLQPTGVTNILIGGTIATAPNVLAGNSAFINGGTGTSLLGNTFPANGGIQLGAGGTPNDPCDADTGINDLQNSPNIGTAILSGGNLVVSGSLDGIVNTSFRIEFFHRTTLGYTTEFLGFTNVTTGPLCTGGANIAYFNSVVLPPIPAGDYVVATATVIGGGTSSFGDTSEFGVATPVATPVSLQSFGVE